MGLIRNYQQLIFKYSENAFENFAGLYVPNVFVKIIMPGNFFQYYSQTDIDFELAFVVLHNISLRQSGIPLRYQSAK